LGQATDYEGKTKKGRERKTVLIKVRRGGLSTGRKTSWQNRITSNYSQRKIDPMTKTKTSKMHRDDDRRGGLAASAGKMGGRSLGVTHCRRGGAKLGQAK